MSNSEVHGGEISSELVYEIISCIIEKKLFRNKVPYTLITKTINTLLEQSLTVSVTADKIVETYKSAPVIQPYQIVDQPQISKNLTTQRKEELADIINWLMPCIKQTVSRKNALSSSVFIVAMGQGQGKTTMVEALQKSIIYITKEILKVHKKNIVKVTLNSEIDAQNLDVTQYAPGSIVIFDGMMKSQAILSVEDVNYVIFTETKTANKIKTLFSHNPVYTIELADMNITQTMELIFKRFICEEELRPKIYMSVQKLLEAQVSPKKILSLLDYSSELENQVNSSDGFKFNQTTLEYVAHHAGITFGYDFNLSTLETSLKKRVYGQDHVLDLLIESVGIAKYGMSRKNRPLLTAIFGGPTGVGKTETASGLSDHLFGKDTLIRVDMGEYTEHHSVSRLIGSPPGYVGYATDTAFAAALKKTTRRVILFDEIEKAASNIHELLLGMLDSGRLTLSTGELLDLRESVIIMTTNALADQAGKSKLGFQETEESRNLLSNYREALLKNKVFAPEFVNRMDLVLPFKVLDKTAASAIALREIEQIREELSYQGFTLSYTQEAFDKALKNSDSSQGGRGIIRSIDSWKREIVSKIRKNIIVKENEKKIIVIEGSNVW